VDERLKFVAAALEEQHSVTALCRAFGVSRKSAYKWIARYRDYGPEGLLDRSRAPKSSPQRIAAVVEQLVVATRKRHPTWGPKKIAEVLLAKAPELDVPSRATIANVLQRHALVRKRAPRPQPASYASPLKHATQPNDVWCVDFKGDFRTGDGRRCFPLTMTDAFSRYVLCCQALRGTRTAPTKDVFEEIFNEYGLPFAIRSDNGTPFSSPGGLSALAVWWIKLGIRPERIKPGRPQQNGRHERMHRTLKEETARPPKASLKAQQRAFDRFTQTYNDVRPHEGIAMQRPRDLYRPSSRSMPKFLPDVQYPRHFERRRVNASGEIKLNGKAFFVTRSLRAEELGLEPLDDGLWAVHFGMLQIGSLDVRIRRVEKRIELGIPTVSPMSLD
jgi:transposase InsO family protein